MEESPWRSYFDFSTRELTGIWTLVVLILLCIGIRESHPLLFPLKTQDISAKEEEIIASLEANNTANSFQKQSEKNYSKKELPAPFDFDPHQLTVQGYTDLGFSPKQSESIVKYFTKGGKLRKVTDFKKLYVVDDFMYERLKPHIKIAETKAKASASVRSKWVPKDEYEASKLTVTEAAPRILVNINTASNEELMAIRGIGPIYASRIMKYRDMLGGYVSTEQLSEVYGLMDHPDIIVQLQPYFTIGDGPTKLDINTATWVQLVKHPYIDKHIANSIVNMRKAHGKYAAVADLQRSHLIDEVLLNHLRAYLTVEGE
jgi:competence protein ComEA